MRDVRPARWRRPRRTGLPRFLYVAAFEDGSKGWYWPDSELADRLWRDDYEVTIVWWDTGA